MRTEAQHQESNVKKLDKKIHDLEASSEELASYYDGVIEKKNHEINDLERQLESLDKQLKADKKFIEVMIDN